MDETTAEQREDLWQLLDRVRFYRVVDAQLESQVVGLKARLLSPTLLVGADFRIEPADIEELGREKRIVLTGSVHRRPNR